MSLSRLWQQQGQRIDAYQLLAPIYDWFPEGFDEAEVDVQDGPVDVTARNSPIAPSWIHADGRKARFPAPHQSPNSWWGQPCTLCQPRCG